MKPEEFIASGTLEAYALGTATSAESTLAETMLAQYPEVVAEYESIANALETFAGSYAKPAPAAAWAAIARAVAEENQATHHEVRPQPETVEAREISINAPISKRGGKQVFLWQWSSAALAAMLLLSVGVNFYFYRSNENLSDQLATLERDNEVIARTASYTQQEVAQLKTENSHMDGLLTQALMPQKGIIEMKAMPALPKGKMSLSYDKSTRMVALRGADMPDMPEGKVVQLWAIVEGKPVSLGLATKAAEGELLMAELPAKMGEPQAFALSLETGSAKAAPEGPILAMGAVL